MALPWTRELKCIAEDAEQDAQRMGIRLNTVILLSSMLKHDSIVRDVLTSLGVTRETLASTLNAHDVKPEPPDAVERLYERSTRLATYAQESVVSIERLLLSMVNESSTIAYALLTIMGVSLENVKNVLANYKAGHFPGIVQYQSAVSHSGLTRSPSVTNMGAYSLNSMPSPSVAAFIPTTYTPETKAEESREMRAFCPALDDKSARRRLITADEIDRLTNSSDLSVVEPATHTTTPNTTSTVQSNKTSDTPSGTQRAAKRNSLRESQQATALDLARRLRTKSRLMAAALDENTQPDTPAPVSDSDVLDQAVAMAKDCDSKMVMAASSASSQAVVSIFDKTEPEDESTRSSAGIESELTGDRRTPEQTGNLKSYYSGSQSAVSTARAPGRAAIITRKSIQEASKQAARVDNSLYTRNTAPLPTGYNPFSLSPGKFPILSQFGRNLLAAARDGKIDPVIERDHEIDQLIDILHKRRSNNPVLVGEAGVGKTAIIEGLALRMAKQQAPRGLENHTIIALDYGAILCGTQLRGAVQERINAIKKEVRYANGLIILFFDEIHTWLSPASSDPNADAALELKLALSRGELMCIGASTPAELRHAFDADPAFERRFDLIEVKAPNVKTSIQIIKNGIIRQYADHHGVNYTDDAIANAVRLADRYIQERALPDKALSVLDRAGSLCVRSNDTEVTTKHVAEVIAQLTEVPVERLLMTEKQKLMQMEDILGERLIGHEKNIARIAQVIRRNQAGFGAQRPIGSFLFLGPTGVGKTEAAKVLADFLFGSRKHIVRFDMSEFMEQHSVAKLIGAPAGYVGFDDGGLLTEALRKRPYQIVLFDEIEKAHPDVMNILLQILDEGRLTDAKGRHVDFSNTVVILTSNIGAQEVMEAARKGIGFSGPNAAFTDIDAEQVILKAARSRFTPELYNRIEEKLVFHALTRQEVERIASLLLNDSKKRLFEDKHIELNINEDAIIPYLIEHGGYDPMFGARPMRQTIQSLVESKIADWILSHDALPESLDVDLVEDTVTVSAALTFPWQSIPVSL